MRFIDISLVARSCCWSWLGESDSVQLHGTRKTRRCLRMSAYTLNPGEGGHVGFGRELFLP